MEYISLPVKTDSSHYGNKYFLLDNEGLEIISTPELGYTEDVLEEIALAINAHAALLAACEAQAKFEQHAVHCDQCGRAEKYCAPGWQLWNTAGNLRNQAIAKGKGDQCTV